MSSEHTFSNQPAASSHHTTKRHQRRETEKPESLLCTDVKHLAAWSVRLFITKRLQTTHLLLHNSTLRVEVARIRPPGLLVRNQRACSLWGYELGQNVQIHYQWVRNRCML